MRGRGVNVGSCISAYARHEVYCGVLTAAGFSCATATAIWEWLASARPSSQSQHHLADATDASAMLVSAVATATAALLYFGWRCVARVRAAHGGIIPFVVRRIGCVITRVIRWHIDTTWTYITLQYFVVSDVDHLKDGRTIFEGVDMVRHRYGLHDDECYNYIFPCERRHSGKLLRVRSCMRRTCVSAVMLCITDGPGLCWGDCATGERTKGACTHAHTLALRCY
jgi:hypothetical protein